MGYGFVCLACVKWLNAMVYENYITTPSYRVYHTASMQSIPISPATCACTSCTLNSKCMYNCNSCNCYNRCNSCNCYNLYNSCNSCNLCNSGNSCNLCNSCNSYNSCNLSNSWNLCNSCNSCNSCNLRTSCNSYNLCNSCKAASKVMPMWVAEEEDTWETVICTLLVQAACWKFSFSYANVGCWRRRYMGNCHMYLACTGCMLEV